MTLWHAGIEGAAEDGNRTVVWMARDGTFGNGARQMTQQAVEDNEGMVVASFSYDPQAPDFHATAQRVKAEDPNGIVLQAMIEQGLGLHDSLATMRKTLLGSSTLGTHAS